MNLTYLIPQFSVKRIFKVGLIVAITLLLCESTMRIWNLWHPLLRPVELMDTYGNVLFNGRWRDGTTRFYAYKPGDGLTHGHPFRVNSWGFRGGNIPKKSSIPRVVVIGDSITSGIGIAEEDRYTDVAQKIVGPGVEIINLSVQGFDGPQMAMLLDRYGKDAQPDYVVWGFYVNDPRTDFSNYRHDLELPPTLDYLLSHSLTFRVLRPQYDHLYRWWYNLPSEEQIMKMAYDPTSTQWKVFEQSVERVRQWAVKHTGKAPSVFLVTDTQEAKNSGFYQPARDLFEKHGYTWIEPTRDRPDESIYHPVSRWEMHPNELTHQRLGVALAQWTTQAVIPQ